MLTADDWLNTPLAYPPFRGVKRLPLAVLCRPPASWCLAEYLTLLKQQGGRCPSAAQVRRHSCNLAPGQPRPAQRQANNDPAVTLNTCVTIRNPTNKTYPTA